MILRAAKSVLGLGVTAEQFAQMVRMRLPDDAREHTRVKAVMPTTTTQYLYKTDGAVVEVLFENHRRYRFGISIAVWGWPASTDMPSNQLAARHGLDRIRGSPDMIFRTVTSWFGRALEDLKKFP